MVVVNKDKGKGSVWEDMPKYDIEYLVWRATKYLRENHQPMDSLNIARLLPEMRKEQLREWQMRRGEERRRTALELLDERNREAFEAMKTEERPEIKVVDGVLEGGKYE